jgi:hypothetical protein
VEEHRESVALAQSVEVLARPLTQGQTQISKALRHVARQEADALQLAHELLARRRDVEVCIRHYLAEGELSHTYGGWRHAVVGAQFRAILEGRE